MSSASSYIERRMMLLSLKNLIHHSFLQLYAIKDNESADTLFSWLINFDQNSISLKELIKIKEETKIAVADGEYAKLIKYFDEGCGSYAVTPKIEYYFRELRK